MAIFLRSLPAFVHRSKPFKFTPLPLIHLYFNPNLELKSLPKRYLSTASSLPSSSAVSSSSPSTVSSTEILTSNPTEEFSIPALEWVSRTAFCGELTESDVGKRVTLCGWVALHRVHGGVSFLNLRDHTGTVQITTLPDKFPDAHAIVNDSRLEYVVSIEGVVRSRPSESVNKKMKTGSIELVAEDACILNTVRSKLPFLVTTAEDASNTVKEEIRLRYRCLDLRRPQMSFNIILRHRVVKLIRRYLEDKHGFVEAD